MSPDSYSGRAVLAGSIRYEPYNRLARDLIRREEFGPVKWIEATNVQRQGEGQQWRHKKDLAGGGALPDIGLYSLQDHRFMEAIYKSARLNRPAKLTASSPKDQFRGPEPRGLS